jgi:signal transduction histidine kinase
MRTKSEARAWLLLRLPRLPDLLLAVTLTVFAQLDLAFNLDNSTRYGPAVPLITSTLAATSVLALRRVAPLGTAMFLALAVSGPMLATRLTFTLWGDFVPLLIGMYSVARYSDRTRAWLGAASIVASIVVVMLRNPEAGAASNIPFAAVPFALVFIAGQVLRGRAQSQAADRARAQRLEAEREEAVRAAVADERTRIARELHDIVAHCVSVMVVQAGAAEDLLDRDPPKAREPLHSVQETGRQAIAELGRMLGLLRGEGTQPQLAPQPGTTDLADLVDGMAGIGLPARLAVSGEPRRLPPGVELAVYRVAQEALTNALKHAAPTTAQVELRYEEHAVRISVRDAGRADGIVGEARNRVGHGLIGMRERVAIYGGQLEAGRMPDGGFAVMATVPLEAAHS